MNEQSSPPDPLLVDAAVRALKNAGRPAEDLRTHWTTTERAVFHQPQPDPPVFIKVYRNAGQLEHEVAVMIRAAAANIPVAPVMAFESGPPAVLITEQARGVPLSADYPEATQAAGGLLRQFHALGAAPPFESGHWRWSEFVHDWLESDLSLALRRGVLAVDGAVWLRRHFADLEPALDSRPVVLIHGDFQTDHVLIDPETQRVTALLDFVDAQPGDPLVDVAVMTLFDQTLEPLVLRGYGMDDRDALELLPSYRVLRHLGAANWLAENGVPHLAPPHEEAVRQFIEDCE